MILKGCALLAFIASIALISPCNGHEDDIVEVLLIDGPGGYLPDIGDDIAIDNGIDIDSVMHFEHMPPLDEEYYEDQLITQRHWLNILDNWENYLRLFLI